MGKKTSGKGVLLSWLEDALEKKKFKGLRWSDENEKIFYVNWTHKSSEQWSTDEVEVYEAWAAVKGKLKNKNSKQLKATFRCALNSKKELEYLRKTRTKRYWQFIDPATSSSKKNETELKKKHPVDESKTQMKKKTECLERRTLNSDDLVTSTTNNNSVGTSTLNVDDLITSSLASTDNDVNFFNRLFSADDSSCANAKNSESENLPTFDIAFSHSAYLTPPYKTNESFYGGSLPDYGISYSPYDQNRLTPPAEQCMLTSYKHSTYRNEFEFTEINSSVWQPNFETVPKCIQNSTPHFRNNTDSPNFSSGHKINFSPTNMLTPIMESTESCASTECFVPIRMEEDFLPLEPGFLSQLAEEDSDVDPIKFAQIVEDLKLSLTESEMCSS